MFTQQHFALQAKALGSHVIPELCTVRDWNANGALKWDVSKVESFHRLGNFLVDFFTMDNPAFDLDKFNKKMLEHATVAINSTGYVYLTRDLPGMVITGRNASPTDWTFHHRNMVG
tara:strand:- start:170 stop:517 length:348 start_codon:yes stop_codon:yes gene_type:complete